MAKGNPIVSCRIPRDVFEAMEREIISQNSSRPVEPYDRAAWIVQAIRERLAKLKRGRNKGTRTRAARDVDLGEDLRVVGPDIDFDAIRAEGEARDDAEANTARRGRVGPQE